MPSLLRGAVMVCLCVFLAWSLQSGQCGAADVWSGLTRSFSKPDGADGSLPENQDTLVPGVIFARGAVGGLYNAATEPSYLRSVSPEFTTWATDLLAGNNGLTIEAENWPQLTFGTFAEAYGDAVLFNFDRPAVVYLENDDVYLDFKMTSWTNGHEDPAGGFAYMRAEPPAPEPTGDYNGNTVVDAADYTVWRDTLGQMVANLGDGWWFRHHR